MRLFQRKGAGRPGPERPALACTSGGFGAGHGEWPRSYEAQMREGYLGNPIAQRAVRLVAESVAGAPLASEPAGHEALALVQGPGSQSLLETAAVHLLLHGNAFIETVTDAAGMPAELYALRPERVSVETDRRGWPGAYLYRAGGSVTRFPVGNEDGRPGLLHLKSLHPLDDHLGLGCLGAAMGPIAIHNAAAKWNKALLDNAARPSGAMVFEPGDGSTLSADQFERLRNELEASFAGSANAGRPMLLEGGLRWQALSLTPADMDFVGTKAAAAREIALAFGVPPMLLGLPGDNSYANYQEANRALWRLAILPMAAKILGGLARHLGAWWPGVRLQLDMDAIPALSADRERLWAQVAGADFLDADEKRRILGIDHGR